MIQIRPKQFLSRTVKKLHASVGRFKILKKLNENVYVINLPKDFGITFIFNVEDLVYYKGLDLTLTTHWLMSLPLSHFLRTPSLLLLPDIHPYTAEKVDKILDDEIISIKDSRTR